MSRPFKHPKTGIYWLRKRVPADLREPVGKREELRNLKTRDADEAKRRFLAILSDIDEKWANLRRGPTALSEREAHDLARQVHDAWLAKHHDNPSEQTFWNTDLAPKLWTPVAPLSSDYGATAYAEFWCHEEAKRLLEDRGHQVDGISEIRLAKAVAGAMQRASLALASLAAGREEASTPSPRAPATSVASNRSGSGKSPKFAELVDGWAAEKRPAEKTAYEWRRVVNRFVRFLGRDDPGRVTPEDLLAWKTSMVAAGLRPKTIRDAQLAPIRAIFRWATDNRHLSVNPAERISIDVKLKPGDAIRSFTDEEATLILKAALLATDPVMRWVPWLCAYSGARVSEVCQLRTEDVVMSDGVWCIKFDPEAGSLKNVSSERTVPLHPAVIERGFLDFARTVSSGLLFSSLPPDKFGKRGGNGTKVLGRWVRSLGLTDPRLAPNHSWRHRLKTSGRRYGMAPDIVDAICGHARKSVADGYGEFPISALHRELTKVPNLVPLAGLKAETKGAESK